MQFSFPQIEALEEERLELKSKIRKLAQLGGTRAVALGLEADDMQRVEEYIEDLKDKRKPVKEGQIVKTEVIKQELQVRVRWHTELNPGIFKTGIATDWF